MMKASEAREKSVIGVIRAIDQLIEEAAEAGRGVLYLDAYDELYLTDEIMEHYIAEGYNVSGSVISW